MNLTEKQKQRLAWIIVTAVLIAISIGLGVNYPLPPAPMELLDEINAAAEAEEGFGVQRVARPVQFRSVRVLNDLTVEDDVDLKGLWVPSCMTSAITGTQTLTPTASCYLLSGTSTLTLTLGTPSDTPMVLFVRTSNADLVLDATIKASDNDLNQYDSFLVLYDGSEWVQAGVSAN